MCGEFENSRLFGVELEHYEKMEGRSLSIEGKANRLGKMSCRPSTWSLLASTSRTSTARTPTK
jgi:hypothetical protein